VDCDDDILAVEKDWDKKVTQAFQDFDNLEFLALNVIQDEFTEGAKPDSTHYSPMKKGATTLEIGPTGGWFTSTSRKMYYRGGGFIFLPNKSFRAENGNFSAKMKRKGMLCGILSDAYVYHAAGPKWNAKGKYHKVWKEKYDADHKHAVNMIDAVNESELPEFDVPQKAINALQNKK